MGATKQKGTGVHFVGGLSPLSPPLPETSANEAEGKIRQESGEARTAAWQSVG